jgi:aryl-alcohol dehydrogenase-like predicted oxidoreductase
VGTVQFGLPYGIANQHGQMSVEAATRVLALARAHGVDTVDTAIAYGASEATLGRIGVHELRVVTKLPAVPADVTDVASWVRSQVMASLGRLGVTQVYGLLLHAPAQLSSPIGAAIHEALVHVQADGLVGKIGVSIYSPEDMAAVWPRFHVDLVQVPFNAIDQRLVTSGLLASLKAAGVECHARSVFLQGLLLLPPVARPATFARWGDTLNVYDEWIAQTGLNRIDACLRVALTPQGIDRVVVGMDTVEQAEELLTLATHAAPLKPPTAGAVDVDLLNPAKWTRA